MLKKVYGFMIYWILDFAEEFDRCLFFTVKKIFLYNVLAQLENTVPDNTIYQLKNWQYDLTDIIELYYP